MRVLTWYSHGSYVNALVSGDQEYVLCDLQPGRREVPVPTRPWPPRVSILPAELLVAEPPDVVVIQRLEEIELCRQVLGFEPGREVAAVFLEHNVPRTDIPSTRHPLADAEGWLIVHVTEVNALLWDCGRTTTMVVPHGVPDPGLRYSGELDRAACVSNEPVRRTRVVGSDLLETVCPQAGVDVFGIDADMLPPRHPALDLRFGGNLKLEELWDAMAQRRLYLHLNRWTSLGLSLLEAMHLGMPVVVLAMTAAATLPPDVGAVSADPAVLRGRVRDLLADPHEARRCGQVARQVVLSRHGLARFLRRWDEAFALAGELKQR